MNDRKSLRPKARLPRGFRDRRGPEIAAERTFIDTIRRVYESYGFEPLETPAFEYTDALGKFLPDVDRPNEGVFSLKDDDGQWMSLRYDLTAPLARYVAENFQESPKPFRRYQVGSVWRNEKPGPGRYREFTQFDADTVGSASPAADAELLMMTCDTLEALGLEPGEYVVKFNTRKILDGLLDELGLTEQTKRFTVLRALDKFDRLGVRGVKALLGEGRTDESGDRTVGAGLAEEQIDQVMMLFEVGQQPSDSSIAELSDWEQRDSAYSFSSFDKNLGAFVNEVYSSPHPGALPISNRNTISLFRSWLPKTDTIDRACQHLEQISDIVHAGHFGSRRIRFDPSIIRGLDYYTGAVFEAQLTFPVTNEADETVVFGSVAGGGRYDDLVARFTGQQVPATGISIGVSRLMNALKDRAAPTVTPLVVVLALDGAQNSFAMAAELRRVGIRAETYVGTKKFGDQLKYADRRGAAIAIIEGSDERANGKVTLKDLALGTELAKSIEGRAEWVANRPAQKTIDRADLVAEVRAMLAVKV
jgi:histidyl-tRNA synthetase